MKVSIKQWNAVATWRWDMPEDDVCGICRVQFDGTCPTCKYPGDECTLREFKHLPSYDGDSNVRSSYRKMRALFPYGEICFEPALALAIFNLSTSIAS